MFFQMIPEYFRCCQILTVDLPAQMPPPNQQTEMGLASHAGVISFLKRSVRGRILVQSILRVMLVEERLYIGAERLTLQGFPYVLLKYGQNGWNETLMCDLAGNMFNGFTVCTHLLSKFACSPFPWS